MTSLTLNTHYALVHTPSAPTERENLHAISKQESYARAPYGVRLDSSEIMRSSEVRAIKDEIGLTRWKRRAASKKLLKGFTQKGGKLYSVAKCDWTLGNLVTINSNGNKASYVGVERCHSISACPCCSAAIRHQRALEIQEAIQKHIAAGGGAYFATLTMPHHTGEKLAPMIKTASAAWRKITSYTWWKQQGHAYIRALEITYGQNGWHPHYHLLILTNKPMSETETETFSERLHQEWARAVEKISGKKPLRQAQDFQVCDEKGEVLARYMSKVQEKKWSAGTEMARFDLKKATHESINPFEFLDENNQLEVEKRTALWREYVAATYGARVITWSRGLKARYGIDEISDEEAQERADEIESQKAIYATPARLYRAITAEEKHLVLELVLAKKIALAQKILPDYHTIPRQQWE